MLYCPCKGAEYILAIGNVTYIEYVPLPPRLKKNQVTITLENEVNYRKCPSLKKQVNYFISQEVNFIFCLIQFQINCIFKVIK